MTHREAIAKLESLHDMVAETLKTIRYESTGGDGQGKEEAEVLTALMAAVWRGYLAALEHAIEQLGRMEGLEK